MEALYADFKVISVFSVVPSTSDLLFYSNPLSWQQMAEELLDC